MGGVEVGIGGEGRWRSCRGERRDRARWRGAPPPAAETWSARVVELDWPRSRFGSEASTIPRAPPSRRAHRGRLRAQMASTSGTSPVDRALPGGCSARPRVAVSSNAGAVVLDGCTSARRRRRPRPAPPRPARRGRGAPRRGPHRAHAAQPPALPRRGAPAHEVAVLLADPGPAPGGAADPARGHRPGARVSTPGRAAGASSPAGPCPCARRRRSRTRPRRMRCGPSPSA